MSLENETICNIVAEILLSIPSVSVLRLFAQLLCSGDSYYLKPILADLYSAQEILQLDVLLRLGGKPLLL